MNASNYENAAGSNAWENPATQGVNKEAPGYDDSSWGTIPVPGHWALHDHGIPIYTNSQYLFKPPRPSRATTIPFEFWVNGQNAGLSKGSRNPAEFEVCPLLRSGRNLLAVKELR